MGFLQTVFPLLLLALLDSAFARPPLEPEVVVRTPRGQSPHDVVKTVRREIARAANGSDVKHWESSTRIDRTWNDAVLLQLELDQSASLGNAGNLGFREGIEIICSHCYLKGSATGRLSAERLSISSIVDQTLDEIEDNVSNFTSEVVEFVGEWVEEVTDTVWDNFKGMFEGDFDFEAAEMPTFDFDFDFDVPAMPDVNLQFRVDDFELFMMLDTTLSLGATYTYNLYTSKTLAGMGISSKMFCGIVFSMDLILTADADVDMSSGFHLKLDDGLAVNIELFGKDASDIMFNGGQFEFLPVTVESAGAVFTAVLRLGLHAGFSLEGDIGVNVGAGVDVGVFANVAELTTNITYQPDNEDCELGIEQAYSFVLGAAAGATIVIDDQTWGPMPNTTTPIWYTTLASGCPMSGKPASSMPANNTATATAALDKRQGMSTATITTEVIYTGVNCLSTGLINCPASLQNTSQATRTATFTTLVPSGMDEDDIPFPASITDAVATTVAFGLNAIKLASSSGSPVSYVPPPPTSTGDLTDRISSGAGNYVNSHKPLIIGLSAGLGGAALILILILCIFCLRKRRSRSLDASGSTLFLFGGSPAMSEVRRDSCKPRAGSPRTVEL